MNAHEQRLVESLRERIADLEGLIETGPRPKFSEAALNPALLWRERVVAIIKRAVAVEFGGTTDEISRKSRKRYTVMKRHIAMHLCRHVGMSLTEVAEALDCKHHTTVYYALEHVEAMRAAAPSIDKAITRLERVVDDGVKAVAA